MDYHFEGTLTARDAKRNIPCTFDVPPGAGRIEVRLRLAPYSVHGIVNLVTLTLFDPNGFRGAGHRDGDLHEVSISPAAATPGYLPGPLPAGAWTAQLDTHMVMPGQPLIYSLDIVIPEGEIEGAEPRAPVAPRTPSPPTPLPEGEGSSVSPVRTSERAGVPPLREGEGRGKSHAAGDGVLHGPGWYRGDLHTHTHHSDAEADFTVGRLAHAAREHGLDFVFLTDHNTIAGQAEMESAAGGDLLIGAGIELTTFWGHAVCLGPRRWLDWRIRPGTGGMGRLAEACYAAGQVFIIAHPESPGDPACTGCNWRYGDMMPGSARLVEIWNGPWGGDSNNAPSLALWYDWLNQGLHLVGAAGSDIHGPRDYASRPGINLVYAEALSEAGLLAALLAGHLYLSAGPQLIFGAHDEAGDRCICGDTLTGPALFSVRWSGCPSGSQLRLIVNGRPFQEWPVEAEGAYEWALSPSQADWVLVELRGSSAEMLAITNPIYLR